MSVENNFLCPVTQKAYFIPLFRKTFDRSGAATFKDKQGNVLKSEEGTPLIPIEREFKGGFSIGTGKCASGQAKLKEQLTKRSKKHFESQIKERRDQMVHNFDNLGKQGL